MAFLTMALLTNLARAGVLLWLYLLWLYLLWLYLLWLTAVLEVGGVPARDMAFRDGAAAHVRGRVWVRDGVRVRVRVRATVRLESTVASTPAA